MKRLLFLSLLAAPSLLAGPSAMAAAPASVQASKPEPTAKIVLVAMTGPEDLMKLMGPYHHALLMKRSGKVKAVAIVVYGRAISALSTRVKGIPEPVRKAIAEAHAAGIPIYACEHAMAMAGIAPQDLAPEAQPVEAGAIQVAELVSEGYVPLQY